MNNGIHSIFGQTGALFTSVDWSEPAVAALLTAIVYFVHRRYPAVSATVAGRLQASAGRVHLWVAAAMLLPLVVRLALVPWMPPREPTVADEFNHLLVADTLAAGRLANPPHPLWRHFETIYVLQQPTYASAYPIGQGIILAVGKALTGHPWAGVLLAVVLMCGATSWMLFGCLPPTWAAAGGLLAALHFGLAPRWVNSYWGGAFCAFGGALFFGALCRLHTSPSRAMALMAGLGWAIVWLTRPFESLIPLLISWGLIAALMIQPRHQWRRWLGPIALLLSVQVLAVGVAALHNRAVTGSLKTLPYQLSQQVYGVPQSLLWQKAIPEPVLRFPELKEVYWWQREVKDEAIEEPVRRSVSVLSRTWRFFVNPWFSLPIVLLVFLLKDRQVVLGAGIVLCGLAATMLYPFFFEHYLAAYSCVFFFLIIRGMMLLSRWTVRGRMLGPPIVLFLMLGGVMTALRIVPVTRILEWRLSTPQGGFRTQIADRLSHLGGRHVVFVRYDASHSFHQEWVYNAADIDASPIVWCRTSESIDDSEVMQYYKDRNFWIASVGRKRVELSRYQLNGATESPEKDQVWVLERRPRRRH